MNKVELVAAVAEKTGLAKKDAEKAVSAVVDAVVEIVRRTDSEEGVYHYGAVFIGMTDTDALKIDIYQIFNDL